MNHQSCKSLLHSRERALRMDLTTAEGRKLNLRPGSSTDTNPNLEVGENEKSTPNLLQRLDQVRNVIFVVEEISRNADSLRFTSNQNFSLRQCRHYFVRILCLNQCLTRTH